MSYCEDYDYPFDPFCEHGRIDCAECREDGTAPDYLLADHDCGEDTCVCADGDGDS